MPQYTPHILSEKLNHQALIRQFILTEDKTLIPESWDEYSMGDFWIGTQQELPVAPIQFTQPNFKGYMLGYVIDPFEYQYNVPCIDQHKLGQQGYAAIEKYLHHLSGRFLCIVSDGISSRIYHDASGSFSMMYSADQKIAASCSMLIPYNGECDDHTHLIEKLKVDTQDGIYPFGLTSRIKIKRLLPNHYLDLEQWVAHRHWPTKIVEDKVTMKVAAQKIGSIIEKTIDTLLMQGFNPYMSLTAGVDSRILLSCSKKWRDQINYFTWELPDGVAKTDIEIAKQIADDYQLSYQAYAFNDANKQDCEEWLYRTSLCAGEVRGLSLTTTINSMESRQPYIAGNVAEVCRGVYWQANDDQITELMPSDIVNRLRLPDDPDLIEAARGWLADLPEMSIKRKLDFLYLEQRVGCWASEIAHGHAGGPFHLYPFSNRIIFEWMIRSPDGFHERKNKNVLKEIIKQKSPELMRLAFNGAKN